MMCYPKIPDNSMIRAIKAESDMLGRGKRNKFAQDFSRKMEYLEDIGANGYGVTM